MDRALRRAMACEAVITAARLLSLDMYLLRERESQRLAERERLRTAARARLRTALHEILPGTEVLIFGSITRAGAFHKNSDIDLAVAAALPETVSHYGLIGWLEEAMGRRVDVLLLQETRLREKILEEGERWIG